MNAGGDCSAEDTAQAGQFVLEGLPAATDVDTRIAISGHLRQQAQVRSHEGAAQLVVEILQALDALPVIAVWHARTDAQVADLQRLAPAMRAHLAVIVTGSGLQLRHTASTGDTLILNRCESVLIPGVAAFTHRQPE